jgi:hypothetical protein
MLEVSVHIHCQPIGKYWLWGGAVGVGSYKRQKRLTGARMGSRILARDIAI